MGTSKLTPNTTERRIYTLVKIQGKTQLAVKAGDHWEIDATCRSINELLEVGLISEEVALGWVHRERGLVAL